MRVTRLQQRSDWKFVKFAYLPALVVGAALTKLAWPFLVAALRFNPCVTFGLFDQARHHAEEWANEKPLLALIEDGLTFEDGGEEVFVPWSDILAIALLRREEALSWFDHVSGLFTPPYWLLIEVVDPDPPPTDSEYGRYGYLVPRGEEDDVSPNGPTMTICVWPRQVRGGLFTLVRFAKSLQVELVARGWAGSIPNRLAADSPPMAWLGLTR